VITQSAQDIFFDVTSIVTTTTSVNCGTPVFNIVNNDVGKTAFDSDIFALDQSTPNVSKFTIGQTSNYLKGGQYKLVMQYYYSNAPGNMVTSNEFIVDVIDACDPHLGTYP